MNNPARRRFLTATTAVVGAIGAGYLAIPFIKSMEPSEATRAAGAPVTVGFGKLEPGQMLTVTWRGRPVWILRRTPEAIERLHDRRVLSLLRDPDSQVASQQPPYAQNPHRSIRDDVLVAVGLCTHLGCVPIYRPELAPADLGADWPGGFFCPCHSSKFDLAGRVFAGVPAPTNLVIPPHHYLTPDLVRIGVGPGGHEG